ncbi:hypothetical protein [Zooshikella sp. RANM57]|uniref:hypothetical protein n=1 Tax=Zooshikella sp. RANM57 TaxID=3425863 RepID=UPI003D6EC96C
MKYTLYRLFGVVASIAVTMMPVTSQANGDSNEAEIYGEQPVYQQQPVSPSYQQQAYSQQQPMDDQQVRASRQALMEDPSGFAMAGDLLVARPLLLGATVLGTAFYVVSLPFSLPGGNADQAAETLIGIPARATFKRCLGCTVSGE